jgi:DNA-binding transcriptional ArsR family regulator
MANMENRDHELKKTLEKILAVLKLANNEVIAKEKEKILKNEIKKKIYELCDGQHTVGDISTQLNTTQPNVSYHLSSLNESGLVLFDEMKGKRYYYKSLE